MTVTYIANRGELRDDATGESGQELSIRYAKGNRLYDLRMPVVTLNNESCNWGLYEDEGLTKVYDTYSYVNEDLTLYVSVIRSYTIIAHSNGGTFRYSTGEIMGYPTEEGTNLLQAISINSMANDLVKENSVIEGWYYDAACTEPIGEDDVILRDIDIYPKWGEGIPVTFIANSGKFCDSEKGQAISEVVIRYTKGSLLGEKSVPMLNGADWTSWHLKEDLSDAAYIDSDGIEAPLTPYAKAEKELTEEEFDQLIGEITLKSPSEVTVNTKARFLVDLRLPLGSYWHANNEWFCADSTVTLTPELDGNRLTPVCGLVGTEEKKIVLTYTVLATTN